MPLYLKVPWRRLIGNIVGWLLVEDLKMREIGYIDSKYFRRWPFSTGGVAYPFQDI